MTHFTKSVVEQAALAWPVRMRKGDTDRDIARARLMNKAATEYMAGSTGPGPFSLDPKSPRYNPSGIYGDATLATAEKGRIINEGMTKIILEEIEELRRTTLPKLPR